MNEDAYTPSVAVVGLLHELIESGVKLIYWI